MFEVTFFVAIFGNSFKNKVIILQILGSNSNGPQFFLMFVCGNERIIRVTTMLKSVENNAVGIGRTRIIILI